MADVDHARPRGVAAGGGGTGVRAGVPVPDDVAAGEPFGVLLPLLVAALTGGLLAQAGFYPRAQWYLGALVAAATLVAATMRVRPVAVAPAVAAGALAGWALADGVARQHAGAGLRYGLLLAGVLAVGYAAAGLTAPARATFVDALLGVGVLIAFTGWLGVLLHRPGWAWLGDHLWRAAATLTYPNATAAVLAALALTAFAHQADRPRTVYAAAATALLVGLGATLSRAGVLGLLVGLAVLAAAQGPRRVLRAATMPAVGALVAVAGLVPSMQAGTPGRPLLAVTALLAGLAVGVTPQPRTRTRALAAGSAVLAVLAVALTAAHGAIAHVARIRGALDSPDRTAALRAAWHLARTHLLTGAGPGLPQLVGGTGTGTGVYRYAHDEYVQVLAELGIPGLLLLLAFLVLVARALLRARTQQTYRAAALAACAALAVHAGLDFLWHLPAIPLLAAALAGLAAPTPGGRPIPGAVPVERGL